MRRSRVLYNTLVSEPPQLTSDDAGLGRGVGSLKRTYAPTLPSRNAVLLRTLQRRAQVASTTTAPCTITSSIQENDDTAVTVYRDALGAGKQTEESLLAVLGVLERAKDAATAAELVKMSHTRVPLTQAILRALRRVYLASGDHQTAAALLRQLAPLPDKTRAPVASLTDLAQRRASFGEKRDWWSHARENGAGYAGKAFVPTRQ